MDKYLYLLRRKEHALVQKIDQTKCLVLGQNFEFETTRNNLDLIIVSEDPNLIFNSLCNDVSPDEVDRTVKAGQAEVRLFEKELDEEENSIREAIKKELERRRDEEFPEERPRLPNYEDVEGQEPRFGDWEDDYDDFPYDDNEELDEWLDKKEARRNRGEELSIALFRITTGRQMVGFRDYGGTKKITEELNELYPPLLLSDFENFYSDSYTNFQLKLLDDRIRQIKLNRARLHSGNLLGCFTRYWDNKGGETGRTIRLFLDNIENEANRRHVDRMEIIANVYIHELFHAYYSQGLVKRHALVNCVNEVEEAMAEFGMLCFMESAFPQFLTTAKQSVQDKLNSPGLRHYGLGFCLYNIWGQPRKYFGFIFNGKLLSLYQSIQLSIRNSRKRVSYLNQIIKNNVVGMPYQFDYKKCIKVIYDLFDLYDFFKRDGKSYYLFNGKTFGYHNEMVYAVLEYYNQYNNPTYSDIIRDFARSLSYDLKRPCFLDETKVTNANVKYYELNRKITLSCGTVIVPRRMWTCERNGDTVVFMKEVDWLQKRRRLDKHVLYLG